MFWNRLGIFCTGFFCGVLATLLPPIVAMASAPDGADPFPPAPYFLLALGVGLLIGLATLVIGAREPH